MRKHIYELYDTGSEQVLDRQEMTEDEARIRNGKLRNHDEPYRWIIVGPDEV